MKNKNKAKIIYACLLFVGLFFAVGKDAKADDCSDCVSAYGEGFCMQEGFCANSTAEPYVNIYDTSTWSDNDFYNNYSEDTPTCDNNYDSKNCCEYNEGYWYNNTCNSEPKGSCPSGYYPGRDGNCYPSSNLDTSSCNNKYDTEYCCQTNGGYWYNNTCNTDPQKSCPSGYYLGRDEQCYPESNQNITQGSCPYGQYLGKDGQCYSNQNLSVAVEECKVTDDCLQQFGKGYKCVTGSCMVDGFFDSTECRTDSDCERYYGSGYECSGIFISTCEKKAVSTTSTNTNSIQPVAITKQPIQLANGTIAPAKTSINPDGSGLSPDGTVYPAGSFIVPGDVNSGFVLCGNGILASECRDINGNEIAGVPLDFDTGYFNQGLPGGLTGPGGVAMPKCGVNFTEVAGVCFPTNTGLSNAPIFVILSNIFSWLIAIFTILAIMAFVISGIQYLSASANEELAKTAKKNANNAIIGIIVGLSGYIIIQAVTAALAGQGYFF